MECGLLQKYLVQPLSPVNVENACMHMDGWLKCTYHMAVVASLEADSLAAEEWLVKGEAVVWVGLEVPESEVPEPVALADHVASEEPGVLAH